METPNYIEVNTVHYFATGIVLFISQIGMILVHRHKVKQMEQIIDEKHEDMAVELSKHLHKKGYIKYEVMPSLVDKSNNTIKAKVEVMRPEMRPE